MRSVCTLLMVAVVFSLVCIAGPKPTAGTIISETSVDCGTKKSGKKSSTSLVCQQYVIHTATTEYQVRQPKPAQQEILPANTAIQFTLNKDKMKFKVSNKSYEFLVVGTSTLGAQ